MLIRIIKPFVVAEGYSSFLPDRVVEIDDVIAENWMALGRCEQVQTEMQPEAITPAKRRKETASRKRKIETR